MQDLWVINQHAVTPHTVVPGPLTIPLQIPLKDGYFIVNNLTAGFFSIPIDEANLCLPSYCTVDTVYFVEAKSACKS